MKGRISVASTVCILMIGCSLSAVVLLSEDAGASAWNITTVDRVDDYQEPSLALDSNAYPHIAYNDWNNSGLKYARWTGNEWRTEFVDRSGWVGWQPSIAIDSNGYAHVSYHDATNGDLKYARWNGSAWVIEVADSLGDVGAHTSIALDSDDYPHISYWDGTNEALKYARWNGTVWLLETVGSTGRVGGYTSLALDNNSFAHISYYDVTNEDLKYARWNGTVWLLETVDSAGRVGGFTSLALDNDGHPHISYTDITNLDLKYAKWNGSGWSTEVVDSTGYVGTYTSLALDIDGHAHISYYDMSSGDLRLAEWTGNSWSIDVVDSAGDVGCDTSMALDRQGYAHISYLSCVDYELKYATERGPNHSPMAPSVPSGYSTGKSGTSYDYSTSTTDPDGDQVEYVFDWGDGNTSQTGYFDSGTSASETHAWSAPGTYYVRAMATDTYGAPSGWSGSLAVTICEPPSEPRNLTASSGDGQVVLSWIAPIDDGGSSIANYSVYRGMTSGGEIFLATIENVTTYTDRSVINGHTYYYEVSAVNGVGEGPKSVEVSATPTASAIPGKEKSIFEEAWFWAVVAVIITAMVLSAIFILKKMKKGKSGQEEPSPPSQEKGEQDSNEHDAQESGHGDEGT